MRIKFRGQQPIQTPHQVGGSVRGMLQGDAEGMLRDGWLLCRLVEVNLEPSTLNPKHSTLKAKH